MLSSIRAEKVAKRSSKQTERTAKMEKKRAAEAAKFEPMAKEEKKRKYLEKGKEELYRQNKMMRTKR